MDEFAYYYLASVEAGGKRRVIYCEHGNQLDAANTVEDYHDGLDTPLGHHVVMDFTRRIAPYGEISPGLDLAEIKMVYPLVAIPGWVASRYFYNFVGKVIKPPDPPPGGLHSLQAGRLLPSRCARAWDCTCSGTTASCRSST